MKKLKMKLELSCLTRLSRSPIPRPLFASASLSLSLHLPSASPTLPTHIPPIQHPSSLYSSLSLHLPFASPALPSHIPLEWILFKSDALRFSLPHLDPGLCISSPLPLAPPTPHPSPCRDPPPASPSLCLSLPRSTARPFSGSPSRSFREPPTHPRTHFPPTTLPLDSTLTDVPLLSLSLKQPHPNPRASFLWISLPRVTSDRPTAFPPSLLVCPRRPCMHCRLRMLHEIAGSLDGWMRRGNQEVALKVNRGSNLKVVACGNEGEYSWIEGSST